MPSTECEVTKHPCNLESRLERVHLVIICVSVVVGDTHTPSAGTNNLCNFCKKKGHLASVCRKNGGRKLNESGRHEQSNMVMEEEDNEQDEQYEE